MFAFQIRTPSDFRRACFSNSHTIHEWVSLQPPLEAEVRQMTETIFNGLRNIRKKPEQISSFLDDIGKPLSRLQALCIQIVAVSTEGSMKFPASDAEPESVFPNWVNIQFIIAPDPSYFSVKLEDGRIIVHKLTTECDNAIRLVDGIRKFEFEVYESIQTLENYFEQQVPWCPICFLKSITDNVLPDKKD